MVSDFQVFLKLMTACDPVSWQKAVFSTNEANWCSFGSHLGFWGGCEVQELNLTEGQESLIQEQPLSHKAIIIITSIIIISPS